MPDFTRSACRLFGLSRQTTDYQRELVARLALPFPILSDAEGRFAAALRLPSFTTGGEIYLKRLTLVIEDGRIERVFYPSRIRPVMPLRCSVAWPEERRTQSDSSSASSTE